jgi:hypothetical protein
MPVVVAEEGNKRAGGPSSSELRQCILDIKSWFVSALCFDLFLSFPAPRVVRVSVQPC